MFSRISVTTLTFLVTLAGIGYSAPLDVYTPPLVTPAAGEVWQVGTRQKVTWDTSTPPKQITNRTGTLFLSQNGTLLDYKDPLARGFDIMDGRVWVDVPKVPTANNYQLVLMGDSGNAGPIFAIQN